MSLVVFVGLDDHQAFVQARVMDAGGTMLTNRQCDSSAAALNEGRINAVGWISAVRSCGDLGEQGCWVVNPLLDEIVHR